jgi:prepilin-type N-terminal cleavage/methylation domain-containing protein
MSNNKIFKKNSGFTLLEVMAAIFIISVGVGGIAIIMPSLISGTSLNQSRLTAAYLAQEGIEIVRNIRDTNWLEAHNKGDSTTWDNGFATCSGNGCEIDYLALASENPTILAYSARKLKFDSTNGYNYTSGTTTKFSRKIIITPDGANILKISADVSWQDKGKTYNFPVQEEIYKWY